MMNALAPFLHENQTCASAMTNKQALNVYSVVLLLTVSVCSVRAAIWGISSSIFLPPAGEGTLWNDRENDDWQEMIDRKRKLNDGPTTTTPQMATFPPQNYFYGKGDTEDAPRTFTNADLNFRRHKRSTALWVALGLGLLGTWGYVSSINNYNYGMYNSLPYYMPYYNYASYWPGYY